MYVLKLVNPLGLRFSISVNNEPAKQFPADTKEVQISSMTGKVSIAYVNPNDTLQHRQVLSFDGKASKYLFGDGHILVRNG